MKHKDEDVTYAFGFLRDVFRLRQDLDLRRGLFVVGKNAYRIALAVEIEQIVQLMEKLEFPLVHQPNKRVLDLACRLSRQLTHVLTHDQSFLQLASKCLYILLPSSSGDYIYVSGDMVKSYVGVDSPSLVTLLSLTTGERAAQLTKRQAIRLIELHGNLDNIYKNLGQVTSAQIRVKLTENENRIRSIYADLDVSTRSRRQFIARDEGLALDLKLNNQKTRTILSAYGFYSLARQLELKPSATGVAIVSPGSYKHPSRRDYNAIVDRAGLRQLESVVRAAGYCAIDTESDDRDPRRATLFGVSFAVRDCGTFFVPFLEKDLKRISRDDVAQSLRKILGSTARFIGHNIKYDHVLLLRHNLRIKTVHFDTMLAAHECYGDWRFFNLPYLAEKLLNRKIRSYTEIVGKEQTFLELPLTEIVQHACEDADVTLQLHGFLQKELAAKEIEAQYFAHTMSRLRELGEFEHCGIRVSTQRLEQIRVVMADAARTLKALAFKEFGTSFDLDSQKALELIVRGTLNLQGFIGTRKISPAMLVQLAVNNPRLQLVVRFKRARKRLAAVEAMIKCVDGNKVHPLFNQIRSTYGALSSKDPNLFDIESIRGLSDAFGKEIRSYFRAEVKSLDALQEMAGDKALREDRENDARTNVFLATHPLTSNMEPRVQDELVLSFARGYSDFEFSKRFLVDRLASSTMRHEVQLRYRSSFLFLEEFRRTSLAQGYASSNGMRKYLAGLKSSDLRMREKAEEHAVRWLLQY